jgi:hypothetical protein
MSITHEAGDTYHSVIAVKNDAQGQDVTLDTVYADNAAEIKGTSGGEEFLIKFNVAKEDGKLSYKDGSIIADGEEYAVFDFSAYKAEQVSVSANENRKNVFELSDDELTGIITNVMGLLM